VDGVAAFSPVSLALDVAFIAAALAMLITMSRSAAAQITIGHESREPG
jgi:hypothetical protein